jgi:hypothetical protein
MVAKWVGKCLLQPGCAACRVVSRYVVGNGSSGVMSDSLAPWTLGENYLCNITGLNTTFKRRSGDGNAAEMHHHALWGERNPSGCDSLQESARRSDPRHLTFLRHARIGSSTGLQRFENRQQTRARAREETIRPMLRSNLRVILGLRAASTPQAPAPMLLRPSCRLRSLGWPCPWP